MHCERHCSDLVVSVFNVFVPPPPAVVLPSSTYLFTVGVEGFYLHLITLRHAPQSVGLLWTRDRPVAETSTWQHKHCTGDKHPCPPVGIRTHDPSKRSAAGLRLRPRSHWEYLWWWIYINVYQSTRAPAGCPQWPDDSFPVWIQFPLEKHEGGDFSSCAWLGVSARSCWRVRSSGMLRLVAGLTEPHVSKVLHSKRGVF
jgi:hypothetical protein